MNARSIVSATLLAVVATGCGKPSTPPIKPREFRATQIVDLPLVAPDECDQLIGQRVVVHTLSPLPLGDGWVVVQFTDPRRPTLVFQLPPGAEPPRVGEPARIGGTFRGLITHAVAGCPVPPPFVLVD